MTMAEVPSLPSFIGKLDFMGATENDGQQAAMLEQERVWSESVTMETMKSCFFEFEKAVAVKGFPPISTPASVLAQGVQRSLCALLRQVVEKGGRDSDTAEKRGRQEEVWRIQLHTWTAMLNAGPGSTHLKLMQEVWDSDIELFFQGMTSQQIASLLELLKRDFNNADNVPEDDYGDSVFQALRRVLVDYTEDQYKAVQLQMADLYVHCLSRTAHASERMTYTFEALCSTIEHTVMKRRTFSWYGMRSTDGLRKHLEALKLLMFHDAFHVETSTLQRLVSQAMYHIFGAIVSEQHGVSLVEIMFGYSMQMFLDLCKHEKCRSNPLSMGPFEVQLFKAMSKVPSEAVFTCCLHTMTEAMTTRPIKQCLVDVIDAGFKAVLLRSEEQVKLWLQWFITALKTGRKDLADAVRKALVDENLKKVFKWKLHLTEASQVLGVIGKMKQSDLQDDEGGCLKDTIDTFNDTIKEIFKQLRHARVLPQVKSNLVECILDCLEIDPPSKASWAEGLADSDTLVKLNIKEMVADILERLLKLLRIETYPWDGDAHRTVTSLLEACLGSYSNGRQMSDKCNQLFLDLFMLSTDGEDVDHFFEVENPDCHSIHFHVLCELDAFIQLHRQSGTMEVVMPLVPSLFKWYDLITTEADLMGIVVRPLHSLSRCPAMKDHYADLLKVCLETENHTLMYSVSDSLYRHNPAALHESLPKFFEALKDCSNNDRHTILSAFHFISASHPEVFTEPQIGMMLDLCGPHTASINSVVLVMLREISTKRPENVAPFLDAVTDDSIFSSDTLNVRCGIITSVGHVNTTLCQRGIDYLVQHADDENSLVSLTVVASLRGVVQGNEECFEKHKARLQELEKSTANPSVAENCRGIILSVEGRNVEGLSEDLREQKGDIVTMGVRVTGAEDDITDLGVKVDDQGREMTDVKKDVEAVETRVEGMEEDLEDTKIRVEEVDNKTMTNAPKWSRDLTKLMNPESDNDWRLMARRLGYSNDDIRGWATQHDPCMALLSEWYAVRKTSEASKAVYTALEEMDRMDGLAIVENAMKAAEGVVEDEEFEYASPPPIFLSYQWGMQEEVKLLHKHLNMAGYQCWMDIGQMGGGDKLFAKIDNGIRAAEVVICCTTEKYAKSPNCNREVNLAVSLGKPIIPLLMEKMEWPPKGSMGPIFSEYLFIRFFQRGGEETKDQRYWPVPKFQELLMQLNFNKVMPEDDKITKEYRNWWATGEDTIVVHKKKKTPQALSVDMKKTGGKESSPDVFLSYQWGKQLQLKELYKRLTGMGYTCWMDIYQMGGGDSLYDKIDRGLRGCKVVVSCVTPKYALSANCRREVSLADALKKPIVPLLLDQMTWPPDGPMSMVFTQLLYINLYRNQEDQIQWNGPQFSEMISQIDQSMSASVPGGTKEKEKGVTNVTDEESVFPKKEKTTNLVAPQEQQTLQSREKQSSSTQKPETDLVKADGFKGAHNSSNPREPSSLTKQRSSQYEPLRNTGLQNTQDSASKTRPAQKSRSCQIL